MSEFVDLTHLRIGQPGQAVHLERAGIPITFWNKLDALDALDALAQHLGLLKNQMEVTGLEDLFKRLDAGRARNAARKKAE